MNPGNLNDDSALLSKLDRIPHKVRDDLIYPPTVAHELKREVFVTFKSQRQ